MRAVKLTKQEQQIEDALLSGSYVAVDHKEFENIAQAVAARLKNTVDKTSLSHSKTYKRLT